MGQNGAGSIRRSIVSPLHPPTKVRHLLFGVPVYVVCVCCLNVCAAQNLPKAGQCAIITTNWLSEMDGQFGIVRYVIGGVCMKFFACSSALVKRATRCRCAAHLPNNNNKKKKKKKKKKKESRLFHVHGRILIKTDTAENRASRWGTSLGEGRRPSRSRSLHRVLVSS